MIGDTEVAWGIQFKTGQKNHDKDYKFKEFTDKDMYEIENELFDKKNREKANLESTAQALRVAKAATAAAHDPKEQDRLNASVVAPLA